MTVHTSTDRHSMQVEAQADFARSLRRNFFRKLIRKAGTLGSFESVYANLKNKSRMDRGQMVVPIEQINGSLGRENDFDRDFNPRNKRTRARWISIWYAHHQGTSLPPVDLYKVGDRFFVEDGHHRISVAKTMGQKYIDAHVIEFTDAIVH
jgi:hypothetical protein